MKKHSTFFALFLAVLLLLSACSGEKGTPQGNSYPSGNKDTNNQSQNDTPAPTPTPVPSYYFDEVVLKTPGKFRDGGQEFQVESRDSNYYGEITISGRSYISGTSNDIEGTYALFVTDGSETQIGFTYDKDGFFGTVSLDGAQNSGNVVFATNDFYIQYMAYGASFSGSFFERINGLSLVRATWSETKGGLLGPSFSMLAVVITQDEAVEYATNGTLPKCMQGLTVTGLDSIFGKPDHEPGAADLQDSPASHFKRGFTNEAENEIMIIQYIGDREVVVIPSAIDELPVTSLGRYVFGANSTVREVIIPDSIVNIGAEVFYGCPELTSVTFGDGLTYTGKNAFRESPKLTSVTFGNSMTTIDSGTFYDCTGLVSLTIPDHITEIADFSFFGCVSLDEATRARIREINPNARFSAND